jgi:hypothetical protein
MLLTFSCKVRGFCPSCHAKRREEWGEWMRESLLSFIENHKVIDKIIAHLKLIFMAERPPPHVVQQELLMSAEESISETCLPKVLLTELWMESVLLLTVLLFLLLCLYFWATEIAILSMILLFQDIRGWT